MSGLVLVAQADPFDLHLLEQVCSECGFDVVTAPDGDTALNVIARQRPALVVVDDALRSADGRPLLELIRADPHLDSVAVLLTVAAGAQEQGRLGLTRGAADFVSRPYRVWEVEHRIRTLLRLAAAERRADSIPPSDGGLDRVTRAGDANQMRVGLEYEMTRAVRYAQPLTCIVLRIDNHAAIEAAGSATGMMAQLGMSLRQNVRGIDHLFRSERDEFVILLPQTGREDADVVLSRLRDQHASLAGPGIAPTPALSLGVASRVPSQATRGEALLRAARARLQAIAD